MLQESQGQVNTKGKYNYLQLHSAEVNGNITKKLDIIQIIPYIALFRFYYM